MKGNNDCSLVDRLWKLLSDPGSGEFYLGNIIKNGLKIPALGIDIAPFSTIEVGDIPKQQMFKEPVLGYMNLTLSNTSLNGIDSYQNGNLTCTPKSPTETDVALTLPFGSVTFKGKYDVGTGGLAGCAIATGAFLTGGGVSLPASTPAPSGNIELAQWYRDVALPKSENGKTMVGAYYAHQDVIEKVQLDSNNYSAQYRSVLAQEQQKKTKGAVVDSTSYYQKENTGAALSDSAPKVGNGDQYAGGFASYIALMKATSYMMKQKGLAIEAGNEYAELLNAATQFNGNVVAFQKTHPAEVDTGTIMDYVDTATPVKSASKIPLFEFPEKDNVGACQLVGEKDTWEVDHNLYLQTYEARTASEPLVTAQDTFNIKGDFTDAAQQLIISLDVEFSNATGSLVATAKSINMKMGNLHITISKSGWSGHESLYDKIASWIANTDLFQDILRSKISSALNSKSTLDAFSKVLNAGIKKLGF